MVKKILFVFLLVWLVGPVCAYSLDRPNNKFGIHLAQPHLDDLKAAADLVNSQGGDFGYLTLVIQDNDKNKQKWQEIFDQMRKLHLVPIIRLATHPQGDIWVTPKEGDIDGWVNFLDSLNWVVKNRFLVLFNEPNHASEWGGAVNPQDFAKITVEFAKRLKEKNADFFLMLGALDASAPHLPPVYQDEVVFLRTFFNFITAEQYNSLFSGLASHSYPNPGFAGLPYDLGRGSIRTYEWELNLFKQFGVKDLPVFITETGWRKKTKDEELKIANLPEEKTVADYFKIAFENIWLLDSRIIAVTPFVFDYQIEPFLGFSWKRHQSNDYYPQYFAVKSLPKVRGDPERVEQGDLDFDLPKKLVANSSYDFKIKLRNTGQAIWDKEDGYQLVVSGDRSKIQEFFFSDLKGVEPFASLEPDFFIKTGSGTGEANLTFILEKNRKKIIESKQWNFAVLPLPTLIFEIALFPKLTSTAGDFEIQIFDEQEQLVFKKSKIKIKGRGLIDQVQNIVLGKNYRLVIQKPYYLPRQVYINFREGNNYAKFKRMYPLDFNLDGKLDGNDIFALVRNPRLISLFFP